MKVLPTAQSRMPLGDYWMIVRRRGATVVIATLALTALAFWLAKQRPPVYQATSAVKFEQSASPWSVAAEVPSYSRADTIETQVALIRSSTILEEVARRVGVVPSGTDVPARDAKAYRTAVDGVGANVRASRVGGSPIIEITATSTNPREAAALANMVAEVYRDNNRQLRNARIVEARKSIETQLRDIETRLKQSEEDTWAFRGDNRIIAPGAESSVLLSLVTQLRLDIERARQQRVELELIQRRLTAAERTSNAERVVVDAVTPALTRLQATEMDLLLERNITAVDLTDEHPRMQAIEDRLREVRRETRREVSAQIAHLKAREDLLSRQLQDVYQRNRAVPPIELGLARLQREQKTNDDLAALLKVKRQEALVKEAEVVEEVAIIRTATEPDAPVSGQTAHPVVLGALLGLVLGLVLAFIQETRDSSLGTIEDLESYLGLPVLGVVPHIDTRATMARLVERRPTRADLDAADALARHALLITHVDPNSPVAEAYRTLCARIQLARLERMAKTIVVTSPGPRDGKTTTIVNLALAMAQNGQKTLLVGANLRHPNIYRVFGIERAPGLSDILLGTAPWRACIRTVADMLMGWFEMEDVMASPGLDNLHIIEAGPTPANPSELLSTPAMGEFLQAVREEYDVILIDTPPVLPGTDSAVVASQVDAVLLVYQAGKVGRLLLKRAKIRLEKARARVLGLVLNDVPTEVAGDHHAHGDTHDSGKEARGGRRREFRNTTLGLLVLAGLLATLGGALAWWTGRLGATPRLRPHEALQESVEARPAPVQASVSPPASLPAPPEPLVGSQSSAPPVGAASPVTHNKSVGVGASRRFALDLGPLSASEAERVEERLNEAGYPTMRLRQSLSTPVYAVLIENTGSDMEALLRALHEEGFADAAVVATDGRPPAVRVGAPLALRGAIVLAERVQSRGYTVRVASQPGDARFVVRHGSYATREEAGEKGEELKRLGLATEIVRIR